MKLESSTPTFNKTSYQGEIKLFQDWGTTTINKEKKKEISFYQKLTIVTNQEETLHSIDTIRTEGQSNVTVFF